MKEKIIIVSSLLLFSGAIIWAYQKYGVKKK